MDSGAQLLLLVSFLPRPGQQLVPMLVAVATLFPPLSPLQIHWTLQELRFLDSIPVKLTIRVNYQLWGCLWVTVTAVKLMVSCTRWKGSSVLSWCECADSNPHCVENGPRNIGSLLVIASSGSQN